MPNNQKMKLIIFFLLSLFVQALSAQEFTISGYVEDINTGERMIGANVIDSISKKGCISNNYGYYSFGVPGPKAAVYGSYMGAKSATQLISLRRDTLLILKINPVSELQEVVVSANQYTRNEFTPLGLTVIPIKTLTLVPSLGETDLLKSIQTQPGVKGGVEGSAGIYVRGGGPGENLFMLDDVPLYNVSHLYGFFSTFNSSAIKDIRLLKGCFPARYGGRTSSVIDVRSIDGNNQSYSGEIAIGLVSSRFTLSGPLMNKKTTFIISGRRSYFDLLAKSLKKMGAVDNSFPDYYFYDLNARLTHTFSTKDRLYLSAYKGKDFIRNSDEYSEINGTNNKFSENRIETSGWGNFIASLRWNHTFGSSLFANTTIAYSTYNFFTETDYQSLEKKFSGNETIKRNYFAGYYSDITDYITKIDFDYSIAGNTIRFGAGNTMHRFNPGKNDFRMDDEQLNEKSDSSFTNSIIQPCEPFAYFEYEVKTIEKLVINIGIRQSAFLSGKSKYFNTEPRVALDYNFFPELNIKAGYSRMVQYMHLLNSSRVSMPTDLWIPALEGIKPLKSDQVNFGAAYNVNGIILVSAEIYRKWLLNTTDYRNGASLATDLSPWYTKTTQGTGNSKGLEISLEKQQGRITGSINYTLSVSDRKYIEINEGRSFPFSYDRLHDLSVSANYRISKKWDVSAVWVMGTGYPVTLPVEKYLPALGIYNLHSEFGGEIDYFPSRNNFRLPLYHRLDIGIHYKKYNRMAEHNLSLDIFNAYNRENPVYMYFVRYRYKKLKSVGLLPVIPTITYTLKFDKQKR